MLENLEGKRMTSVPHRDDFDRVLKQLGPERMQQARDALDEVIDDLPPSPGTGLRVFNSSYIASNLSPWSGGLKHLYDVACELLGESADEQVIEDRAALIFGLFVWERLMDRSGERWVFYDPNLSANDPN